MAKEGQAFEQGLRGAKATRNEVLDFIERTWNFRVSKVAIWEFLTKYGLDRASLGDTRETTAREEDETVRAQVLDFREPGALVPVVPDRFFLPIFRPGPSCCGLKCKPGWPKPASA